MAIPRGWDPVDRSTLGRPGWTDTPALGDAQNVTIGLEGLVITSRHTTLGAGGWAYRLTPGFPLGWWDPAPDATDTMDHHSGDGSIPLAPRRAARIIEVEGWIDCTPGTLMPAIRQLRSVPAGRFVVDDGASAGTGQRLEADVRRTRLAISRGGTEVHCPFRMVLVADDPLRYGTTAHALTNGTNQIQNVGDATAFPVLELTGPLAADLVIQHPGGTFRVPQFTGGSRLVDCRNGDVFDGGGNRQFNATGPWPRVPSGGATWQVSGLGTGAARARRYEAWT